MSGDAADAEPIRTSADLGRALKRWARRRPEGQVKVAALARQLNVSQSTLYAYLAGTTLPPVEVLDDLLTALGVPAAERRRLATARDVLRRRREPERRTPNELPADPAGFTGREPELAALSAVLAGPGDGGVPVRLSTISGPAGVGKTALVVHWGHRVVELFPDGCLYVDLHGYSPLEPRRPADVLAGFLRGLGVEDAGIPDDEHERAARFRSVVSGRRLLVVLDNAVDVDQVRPLLPGSPTCFAVTTSRADLAGLQVEPGARQFELRPLRADDGLALLRAHIGVRVEESEESAAAARRLARHCGGLPLALRIVAAQAVRREQPLPELVAELTEQGTGLFDVGDPATAIGTVFSWSLRHLGGHVADFWLFGAHPARAIDSYAAAALLGTDLRAARGRVERLVRAHLVRRLADGRFDMHDLVRTYASERAAEELSVPDRDAAVARLVGYLTSAATRAMNVLHPNDADTGEPEGGEVALPPLTDPVQARTWLDAEWHNLLAVLAFTADRGWAVPAGDLASVLRRRLDQGGRHDDALVVLGHALHASRLAGDDAAEGAALYDLGVAHQRLGRHEEAMRLQRQALAICRAGSDRNAEAGALNNLGNLYERLGRYAEAIDHYEQALVLVRELDLRVGRATLLTNLGVVHTRLGDHERALRDCTEALAVFREAGDSGGTARTLGNLGEVHRLAGRVEDAIGCYEEALRTAESIGAHGIVTEVLNHLGAAHLATGSPAPACSWHTDALTMARATGDRYEEARALEGIGCVRYATGGTAHAVASWRAALALYRQMGLREADRVAALLATGNGEPRR
ncbi:ATP-binding protein [Actinophytocola glycyrrhizae]|uniref:ATP-binding protein n=1 Tax=Actinophytocola glycyrrhizae TaxID=2044873 RepID=A0ABV9S5X7_9PSEU